MTPLIHHLKLVWEIHLSRIWLITRSFPVSSLSQCCQIIGRVIHMFKSSPNLYWVGHLQLSFHSVSAFPVSKVQLSHTLFHFQTLLLISCHWWEIHQGSPVTSLVPSTSSHHPGLRLRNYSVPWSLLTSMASFSLSTVSLHHWPLIERFHWLFDTKSFIHN